MTTMRGHEVRKYVAAYLLLLVIIALQFVIGYRNTAGGPMAVRMISFSVIETIIVVLFMMNLGGEKRTFFRFVVYFMLFVLAAMNWIWTDSFRLLLYRITRMGPS